MHFENSIILSIIKTKVLKLCSVIKLYWYHAIFDTQTLLTLYYPFSNKHVQFSFEGRYDQEVSSIFVDAVEKLPQESWRQVLTLRFFYNLSPAEIAEALDKTPSAVYNLQFKALNALREIWTEEIWTEDVLTREISNQKGYKDDKAK